MSILLQTGGDWLTQPGSYTAFGLVLIGLISFYSGRIVTKTRVDEVRAECDARFALMKEDRDYHRSVAERLIITNAKAIEVIKLTSEK